MNRTSLSRLLLVAALIASISTLLFWDFVRDNIVIPIYFSLWVSDLVIKSIPQQAYLAILILVCIVLGISALSSAGTRRVETYVPPEGIFTSTRYGHWQRLHANLYGSPLFKQQFALEVRVFLLSLLAYQEGLDEREVEAGIKDGSLSVPGAVEELVRRREFQITQTSTGRLTPMVEHIRRVFNRSGPAAHLENEQVIEVIRFIEARLEIAHGADSPGT